MLQVNTLTRRDDGTATMHLKMEVPGERILAPVLGQVERLDSVVSAYRRQGE